MERLSKRVHAVNQDSFRDLPDPFLSYILSFLPFKEAARTSILSKKWRPIWLSTQNVEFDVNFFLKLDESPENKEIQRRAFIDFMTKWIANYQLSTIDTLALKFSDPGRFVDDLTACVRFAVARKVKRLAVDLSDPAWDGEDESERHSPVFDLPLEIYKHEKLESLTMYSCNFRVIESENIFGNLKELSLGWVELSICCFKKLMTQCKMLESLSLKRCWNLGFIQIKGEDVRLSRLVLDKCSFLDEITVEIEAPKLRFLKYCGRVGVFDLQSCSALKEVELDYAFEGEHDENLSNFLAILLDGIYRVTSLTVCSFMLQVIPNGDEPFGLASAINVQHLTLKALMHPNEFFGIKFFLKSCPILETLTIHLGQGRILEDYDPPLKMDPRRFWSDNIIVYKCLRRSLKVVELNGFTGAFYEFCFLFYILSMTRCLKELKISVIASDPENKASLERILEMKTSNLVSRGLVVSIS